MPRIPSDDSEGILKLLCSFHALRRRRSFPFGVFGHERQRQHLISEQGIDPAVNVVIYPPQTHLRQGLPSLTGFFEFSVQYVFRRRQIRSFTDGFRRIPPFALQAIFVESKIGLVEAVLQRRALCQNAPDAASGLYINDIRHMERQGLSEVLKYLLIETHVRRDTCLAVLLYEICIFEALHTDDVSSQTMNERLSNIHDTAHPFLLFTGFRP